MVMKIGDMALAKFPTFMQKNGIGKNLMDALPVFMLPGCTKFQIRKLLPAEIICQNPSSLYCYIWKQRTVTGRVKKQQKVFQSWTSSNSAFSDNRT